MLFLMIVLSYIFIVIKRYFNFYARLSSDLPCVVHRVVVKLYYYYYYYYYLVILMGGLRVKWVNMSQRTTHPMGNKFVNW